MKEYLTFTDIAGYELAGVTEISSQSPINRFPIKEEVDFVKEAPCIKNDNLKDVKSLAELKEAIKNFNECSLKKTATNTVFGDGATDAKIMFIGDVPDGEDDKKGLPFMGENGELLEKILKSIGLSRAENAYLCNLIPWRPPGGRAPSASEINACLPFVKKHIALINPDIIVFLGATAFNAITGTNQPINKTRGKWQDYIIDETNKTAKIIATYHPSFLLKSPLQKKNVWLDMLSIKENIS